MGAGEKGEAMKGSGRGGGKELKEAGEERRNEREREKRREAIKGSGRGEKKLKRAIDKIEEGRMEERWERNKSDEGKR